jgi:hypothetical protein
VAVGGRNRALAAAQSVGAPVVLTVRGGSSLDVRRALARAGVPDREATPVVIDHAVSRADQTVLFADADGLGSVGAFADRGKARDALRTLRAPASDPIRITGQALSLAVGTDGFYEGAQHPVDLAMVLLHDDGAVASVPVETLPAGTSSPRPVTVAVGCDPGCVLTGWKIITSPANAGQGRIRIQDLRSDTGTPIPVGSADDWRGVPAGESKLDALDAGDGSLTVFVDNAGASELDLDHRWLPASLPAVVAGSLPPGSGKTYFTAHGLDGIDRSMTVAARLPWLPASGPNATVTDLALAERSGTFLSEDAVLQVWCGRSDAAFLHRVRTALAGSGLAITSEARTSDARRELDDSAATWSLRLGIVVGLVCLLVALLGLAIAGAGAWRARLRDLAVLRLNGVARAGVRRVAAVEQVPLLLVSVVLGAVVGMVAAHYALPTLPLLAVDPQVDLTDLSPAWGVVLVLTAVAGAILGVAGWASARAVADAAGPTRVGDLP